jgi:alpha-mannosidase
MVLNSLPGDRHEIARVALPADGSPTSLPAGQLIEEQPGQRELLVEVTAPSYGYAMIVAAAPAAALGMLSARHNQLENADLRITLDEHGEVASLYDKANGRELARPGAPLNQLVRYEDRPLDWDAWDIDSFYAQKAYPVREIVSWELVEQGPLRAAILITRRLGQSTIRQRICLWRDTRRVDFMTEVDWQERQSLLRALFPLDLNATLATCETQFGAVERPTHRNTSWEQARFEVCAHRWVDISEGGYGVALLNDGKYGHSFAGSTVGISLLKSAIFPDQLADAGQHRFTYSLYPHAGDWRAAQVVRRAYELNAPLRLLRADTVAAQVPAARSFLRTDSEHIMVETVKTADDGDGLIVRLYEAHNQRGMARLIFEQPIASAVETDLLERPLGALPVEGRVMKLNVRPFEIKTVRVRLG